MDKIVHFEIPTDNMQRAEKFYKDTFGWAVQPMPEMEYTIVRTGPVDKKMMPTETGFINGGMFKRKAKEAPILVINVASVEDSIKKIKKSGCKVVMEPTKVGDMGLYSKFVDTEGNVMGIWQNLMKV